VGRAGHHLCEGAEMAMILPLSALQRCKFFPQPRPVKFFNRI